MQSAAHRLLPGGLAEGGALRRDYAFRVVDGALELALAEAAAGAAHVPQAVTQVLGSALATLAGAAPAPERIEALCVADRQLLMGELERHLGGGPRWLVADCGACGARFDMQVDPTALPVKPAGAGFPHLHLAWDGHEQLLRVPDGSDQAWLAERQADASPRAAARALAARLLLRIDGRPAEGDEVEALPETWLDAVDAALDEAAPALATQGRAACPECGQPNTVAFDPYGALARGGGELLDEVHTLASHYHWSERDILALPRARRHEYLRRVDAARGLVGGA
ncbi:MAG: hypothetical protein KF788_17960 [Piscinibacter sp.]|nr:hypothetical protein [Piscinibacter sp.]